MSAGMNELENALRQFQPPPFDGEPILAEIGRVKAARAVRPWKWATVLASTTAAALAGILFMRPAPVTEVRVVYLPAAKPAEVVRETSDEPIEPMEPPLSEWQRRRIEIRVPMQVVFDDDEPIPPPRSIRAGDLMRDPQLRASMTERGIR